MPNVEIKAKVSNLSLLLERAEKLAGSEALVLKQHDTFYCTQKGRLKLRRLLDANGEGELIHYNRPDTEGPKLSQFEKVTIGAQSLNGLHDVLTAALGARTDVRKVRRLFLVGQTRVHIDQVEGLGDFMELEVCLKEGQTVEEAKQVAQGLMDKLGIEKEDLISGAYADFL
ncbi:uncharacterized protein LOC125502501 [Dendroctonus ponderosae]|uniref:CYTH domain-containing protein n=3 Tax=Dendroctonus ponderosae TaxID=77166 RepID=U4U8F5_DENPD|nr:uncharacterized protein LOC125502501 [Dendroctonus ponderosae]XP_048516749.1 uncharacterized protein LOC125502501 [Dendroctonus ponderosae]ERL89322.1 hypothetical protein D910_06694 [Dendroctonus ponderosae]KAH1027116.1 hypothetical protein HUJ05_000684 [Dendroctonus ponderosae]